MKFDTEKQNDVESSTFDIVKVGDFHNIKFGTVMSYIWVWMILLMKLAVLGSDTYTCVCILVFKRWSTDNYQVFDYKVAKWVFTGCIGFRFLLLAWQIGWAIHIYRTRNIALAYLNNYSRLMYAIRSYDYQCLFHDVEKTGNLPWATFMVYNELDNALEVLVADCPREVINVMTLKNYAFGEDLNSNVLENIKTIATTNVKLSVILSLILCSLIIYLFFFIKFWIGMLCYIPVKVRTSHKGFKSIKAICYHLVNDQVRLLVSRHHKPKKQLLLEGVLDINEINANSLLHSNSTLNLNGDDTLFTHPAYRKMSKFDISSVLKTNSNGEDTMEYSRPPRAYTAGSLRTYSFDTDSARAPLTRNDSDFSQTDPFTDRRAFLRAQTSDSLMTDRSLASLTETRDQRIAGDTSYRGYDRPYGMDRSFSGLQKTSSEPIVEEDGSYHSDEAILKHGDEPLQRSTDQLINEKEPVDEDEEVASPFLERDQNSSPFSDHSQAPYPVRGVSKYFEHRDQ